MSKQFETYARFYDLLYKEKNYKEEVLYVDNLINAYLEANDKNKISLLDVACGTGKHLFEFSELGYQYLSGSDISSSMIEIANSRVKHLNKTIEFYNYSFQELNKISNKFDVITSMFSAVNYLTTYEDQLQSFKHIYNLLKKDGIFIFDFWNGNAVVRDYSPVKILRKYDKNEEIIRISETEIDIVNQKARVKFTCLYFENKYLIQQFEELHNLHYYYFAEIQNLLSSVGFTIIHQCPFMKLDKIIDPYEWNISIIAKKII